MEFDKKLDLEECAYYLQGLEMITEATFRDFGVTGFPQDPYRDAIGYCLSNSIRMIRERIEEISEEK